MFATPGRLSPCLERDLADPENEAAVACCELAVPHQEIACLVEIEAQWSEPHLRRGASVTGVARAGAAKRADDAVRVDSTDLGDRRVEAKAAVRPDCNPSTGD